MTFLYAVAVVTVACTVCTTHPVCDALVALQRRLNDRLAAPPRADTASGTPHPYGTQKEATS